MYCLLKTYQLFLFFLWQLYMACEALEDLATINFSFTHIKLCCKQRELFLIPRRSFVQVTPSDLHKPDFPVDSQAK